TTITLNVIEKSLPLGEPTQDLGVKPFFGLSNNIIATIEIHGGDVIDGLEFTIYGYINKQKSAEGERERERSRRTILDLARRRFLFPFENGILQKDRRISRVIKGPNPRSGQPRTTPYRVKENGLPRKGFSVPSQVVIDRPHLGPILTLSTSRDGGVQGLRWYAKHLRIDEDGDVADEFLDEVSSETLTLYVDHLNTEPRFEYKGATRPAKVKQQVISNGKLMHCLEH
ncbi:hypothetical protein Lal_00026118, partial [Lupinus albus]